MFQSSAIKVFAVICILISLVFLGYQIVSEQYGLFGINVFKWIFMLTAGYFGFRLAGYPLYDEELKKVVLRLMLAPILAIGLVFLGGLAGLLVAVLYMGWLYSLKSNYDNWDSTGTDS